MKALIALLAILVVIIFIIVCSMASVDDVDLYDKTGEFKHSRDGDVDHAVWHPYSKSKEDD